MLRQLILNKQIKDKRAALEALATQERALLTREEQVAAAIDEANNDEEMQVVEEEAAQIETEKNELTEKKSKLEIEIADLEKEIEVLNSKAPINETGESRNKKTEVTVVGGREMRVNGLFRDMSFEQRSALVARSEVKEFLDQVRALGTSNQTRGVTNAELTIPDVYLDLVRDNIEKYSKLISKVSMKPVKGTARQNIAGTVPEGIWMEATGKLNELNIVFNQIEFDGYKVGGFMAIAKSTLEDSDVNLAAEILEALAQAIGLGVDKAIVYGTGKKMPLGIATRLAQTAKPADWPEKGPDWTDLRTSNLRKFAGSGMTAEQFFSTLITNLAFARENYATGGTIWLMNRTTKMALMAKALAFNAAGAIVAGMNGTTPVEGGEIIELSFIPDNDIIGGFGSLYKLVERAGMSLSQSEHVQFIEDNVVFKATARYDGKPVFGESFVIVNINNASPTTTATFAPDNANPQDAYLSEIKVGALSLSPAFSGAVDTYTVATTSATNAVSAKALNSKATVAIKVNDVAINSGDAPTWETGANTVEITVTLGTTSKLYTVTVTKS